MNEVQCRDLALKVACDYVVRKGIKAGLTGKQHVGILTNWAKESEGLTDMERFAGFLELANGSALRQKLEKLPDGTPAKLAKDVTVATAESYI